MSRWTKKDDQHYVPREGLSQFTTLRSNVECIQRPALPGECDPDPKRRYQLLSIPHVEPLAVLMDLVVVDNVGIFWMEGRRWCATALRYGNRWSLLVLCRVGKNYGANKRVHGDVCCQGAPSRKPVTTIIFDLIDRSKSFSSVCEWMPSTMLTCLMVEIVVTSPSSRISNSSVQLRKRINTGRLSSADTIDSSFFRDPRGIS